MNKSPRPYSRVIKELKSIRNNSWNYLDFTYFRKWILVGFVLGVVAGLGAIALYLSVAFFTSLFLESGSGYIPPLPRKLVFGCLCNGNRKTVDDTACNRDGGSNRGIIVTRFSPEFEGRGTVAVIDAYHHKGGKIRSMNDDVKCLCCNTRLRYKSKRKRLPDLTLLRKQQK